LKISRRKSSAASISCAVYSRRTDHVTKRRSLVFRLSFSALSTRENRSLSFNAVTIRTEPLRVVLPSPASSHSHAHGSGIRNSNISRTVTIAFLSRAEEHGAGRWTLMGPSGVPLRRHRSQVAQGPGIGYFPYTRSMILPNSPGTRAPDP
jgi:hypothetical protein